MSFVSSDFSRRNFLVSIGVITAGAGLAACGGASTSTSTSGPSRTPKTGGTLKIGTASVSPYLNPLVATTGAVAWVTAPVVETLFFFDSDMKSVPLLAAGEPKISADEKTWTIAIRDGISFSNGDPLTAEHVVAVLNHVADPKAFSDWTNYFGPRITSAKAVDKSTVEISLPAPYGIMRSHLNNLPIIHKDFLEKKDTTMGTGPFVIGAVTQGEKVQLTPNKGYHGKASALDEIIFTAVADPATRLVNLREGKIDVMTDVPPDNVALLKTDKDITVHITQAPIDVLTYFNASKPPFNDVRARQALAHAMDRGGVADVVYSGTAPIGQGPIGPATEGYNADIKLYGDAPNVEKAKALLTEAGLDSLNFTLTISSSNAALKNAAQVLVEGWKKAGINCTLDIVDGGKWVPQWLAGEYEMMMNSFASGIAGGQSAYTLLSTYVSSSPVNYGYKNEKVDDLVRRAWATVDAGERAKLCSQADQLLAEDAIACPPVYPSFIVAQRNDITTLDKSLMSVGRINAISVQALA
ncbi:MAG: ABC transporter substrate-binding protein [Dermatophilaceae bacterium]